MIRHRIRVGIAAVMIGIACISGSAAAEPLRILVPEFSGPEQVGKYVMTTMFFEIAKSFVAQSPIEKGAWILYGKKPLEEATHDAAIRASSWPSVRADIVVWGRVSRYGGGLVVQSYLTVTPISEQRKVRPEIWSVSVTDKQGGIIRTIRLDIGLPRTSYEFEPFQIPDNAVNKYTSPRGVPLYSLQHGGKIVDFARGAFLFRSIEPDGILLESDRGVAGWARLPSLGKKHIHAIAFSQGIVRFMRGDWRGAIDTLAEVLEQPNVPHALRLDSLIYTGIAKEKLGVSGQKEFETAYAMNRLDRIGARYVILGKISEIERQQRKGDIQGAVGNISDLARFVTSTRALFPQNVSWLLKVHMLLANWDVELNKGRIK